MHAGACLSVESDNIPEPGLALKNAFVIVTLSSILAACAVAPQQQAATSALAAPAAGAPPDAGQDQTAAATEEELEDKARLEEQARLPKVELTSGLLNQLLKAEFAFRKGDWQGPYLTMLSLAQQTRDPRLARRAAEMAMAARQADDTLAAVRLWRGLDPASDEATQYFVGMVITSDNIAEVEPIFVERLQRAPLEQRGVLLYQVQQLLGRAKDKEAAAAMLERVMAPYAKTLEGHVVMAQAALAMSISGSVRRPKICASRPGGMAMTSTSAASRTPCTLSFMNSSWRCPNASAVRTRSCSMSA